MNLVLAALRDAPHCSVSSIKTYLMCPEKYRHRYIAQTPPSHRNVALVLGRALHDAIEAYYRFVQKETGRPPVSLLTDTFSTSWSRGLLGDVTVKAEDVGHEKDMGQKLVQTFYEGVPEPLEVLAIEESFAFPVSPTDERLIVGAIDAIVVNDDGQIVIVENKSAKRRWSADQLAYDIQPTLYSHAARELGVAEQPALRYDFLLKLRKPRFESVDVFRPREAVTELFQLFRSVLAAIDADIFYRARSWACNDCEYAYVCNA